METGVLEINDCGLRVFCGIDEILESPGVASINSHEIIVGISALKRARSHPTQANSHFWRHLNLEPLNSEHSSCRHYADLAFYHLQEICKGCDLPQKIALAVPGNFTREQLAILLGIIQANSINAVALVDNASVCTSKYAPHGCHLHIELHRQQTLISRVMVQGKTTLDRIETINDAGLEHLQAIWAQLFTDAFIMQCRFDPLHSANSEQLLYNRLAKWIKQAKDQGEALAELEGHTAKLSLRQLKEASRPILSRISAIIDSLSEINSKVFISHRWAEIPGGHQLAQNIYILPSDCIAQATIEHWHSIYSKDENLCLINTFDTLTNGQKLAQRSENNEIEYPATHILFANRAFRSTQPIYIYRQHNKLKLATTPPDHPAAIISNKQGRLALKIDAKAQLNLNGKNIEGDITLNLGDEISATSVDNTAIVISVEAYGTQK